MTTPSTPTHQRSRFAYEWELPEVFSAAITLAVGLLLVGGLAAVLIVGFGESSLDFRHRLGDGLYQGLFWVNAALAASLLLALVLAWWQVRAWTETEYSESSRYTRGEVVARVARSHAIVRWNLLLFGALLAATVLYYVGLLLFSGLSGLTPAEEGDYVIFGMQSVGVLVMTLAGFLGARNVLALRVKPLGSRAPVVDDEAPLGD